MKRRDWEARRRHLLVQEMDQPLGVWYLSFCGDDGFRGACFVLAHGFMTAVEYAHRIGCNPGGEVLGAPWPPDRHVPASLMDRLLTKADLNVLGEEFKSIVEWEREREN